VWVEIHGERRAEIEIQLSGGQTFLNWLTHTRVRNNSYCSDKMGTYYQRLRVFFRMPEKETSAVLWLRAGKGTSSSSVRFDDVRIVKAPERDFRGHDFFEDFEWTDEGWGPFVFAQFRDTHTHLSEAHPPYTDDVINGRFSLKTRNERPGLVYRTVPGLLKLKPGTSYRLQFAYLQDNPGQYSVVIGSDADGETAPLLKKPLPVKKGTFEIEFTTGNGEDTYIGIWKNDDKPGVFVLDDLALDQKK